jgi:hypothetical protein
MTSSPAAHATATATATLTTIYNTTTYSVDMKLSGAGGISVITVTDLGTDSSPTNTDLTSGSSQIDFGNTSVSTTGGLYPNSVTHHLQISNSGDMALNITSSPRVLISNDTNSNWSVTTSEPATPVAPNGNSTFDLTFAATQSPTTTENADIEIDSDANNDVAFTFSVTGQDQYC